MAFGLKEMMEAAKPLLSRRYKIRKLIWRDLPIVIFNPLEK